MNIVDAVRRSYYDRLANLCYERGVAVLPYPPREVFIEPTNACNLRCVSCPQSAPLKKARGFMDKDLLAAVLGEVRSFAVRRINLFFSGESFLHKQLPDLIREVKKWGLFVRIHTNGTVMPDGWPELIVQSGLDELVFSVDTVGKERFEALRPRAKFETITNSIRAMAQARHRAGSLRPRLIAWGFATVPTPEEREYYRRFFVEQGVDETDLRPYHNFGGYLGSTDILKVEKRPYPQSACRQLWTRTVVTWDGQIVACCLDFEGELLLGDVSRGDTVMRAWNSEKAVSLRRAHRNLAVRGLPLCDGCDQVFYHPPPASTGPKKWAKALAAVLLGMDEEVYKI